MSLPVRISVLCIGQNSTIIVCLSVPAVLSTMMTKEEEDRGFIRELRLEEIEKLSPDENQEFKQAAGLHRREMEEIIEEYSRSFAVSLLFPIFYNYDFSFSFWRNKLPLFIYTIIDNERNNCNRSFFFLVSMYIIQFVAKL